MFLISFSNMCGWLCIPYKGMVNVSVRVDSRELKRLISDDETVVVCILVLSWPDFTAGLASSINTKLLTNYFFKITQISIQELSHIYHQNKKIWHITHERERANSKQTDTLTNQQICSWRIIVFQLEDVRKTQCSSSNNMKTSDSIGLLDCDQTQVLKKRHFLWLITNTHD